MSRLGVMVVCVVLGAVLLAPRAASAAGPIGLGFTDFDAFDSANTANNAVNLTHAKTAGATTIRLSFQWAAIAKTKPPSLATAADPSWSGYDWSRADTAIRGVSAAGLQALPFVNRAPAWAEGGGRPAVSSTVPAGTWKPDTAQLRAFASALAKRYSGTFPDPATPGATLPAVRSWQAWNEPNLYTDLTPQWTKKGSGYVAASPSIYRGMLNAFYAGIKSVAPKDTVVTAGTGPFGDPQEGGNRIMPARFWRELLCVKKSGGKLRAGKCPKVRFDVYAHHPYPIGPPRRHARNADDVVVPDLARISTPVALALKRGTIAPKTKSKPLWITELSWDSAPDPDGLSQADQAQYLEGAFNVLYKQNAKAIFWFVLRDQAPTPSWDTTFQSGLFERGANPSVDTPKPSYTAFRFPFTAYRSEGVAELWGMSPAGAGPVQIQALSGTTWQTVATVKAAGNRVFTGRLRVGRGTSLRAVAGTDTSLAWKTF